MSMNNQINEKIESLKPVVFTENDKLNTSSAKWELQNILDMWWEEAREQHKSILSWYKQTLIDEIEENITNIIINDETNRLYMRTDEYPDGELKIGDEIIDEIINIIKE